MHDTASLELCEKLFRLSGWYDTSVSWYRRYDDASITWTGFVDGANGVFVCPAYDLGYLVRKLGNRHVELKRPYRNSEPINLWSCMAVYDDGEELPAYLIEGANTPEDAAALLVLELFKRGILKSKGENQ